MLYVALDCAGVLDHWAAPGCAGEPGMVSARKMVHERLDLCIEMELVTACQALERLRRSRNEMRRFTGAYLGLYGRPGEITEQALELAATHVRTIEAHVTAALDAWTRSHSAAA